MQDDRHDTRSAQEDPTSRQPPTVPGLDFILAAKGRIPPLPSPHVPRPRVLAALVEAVQAHRLAVLAAGALSGKTTLLAELARTEDVGPVSWYSIDEADATPRMLLEGLARATSGTVPPGDETHLLGTVIAALDAGTVPSVLILDDIHRSSAAAPVLERLLRYLPPRAHLVLSGWPARITLPPLYRWLEDQQQVARLGTAELRLDEEERERFRALTRRCGGEWAVDYRPGGQPAVVDGLRRGVLPLLGAEARPIVDLLAILPSATATLLGAVLGLPAADVARRLAALRDETILLEQLDTAHYRLSETARQAALCGLDEAALAAARRDVAAALEAHDPAQAAHLFALAGNVDCAVAAAGRVSWWQWQQRYALARALEALLPDAALRQVVALALVAAHRRLVEMGVTAAHALTRSLRPVDPLDRIQRLLLLAHCAAARRRPWSLSRCVAALEALAARHDRAPTLQVHAYGLLALGIARGLAGLFQGAADALRSCLDVLALDGGSDVHAASMRLLAYRAVAMAEHQLGRLAEAERLYAEAEAQAQAGGTPYVQLELANNRAVLLQQRGAHAESADLLRSALASPWSAERSLRPLLYTSLADALGALGDRTGAAQALHNALQDLHAPDVYGLQGHVHAARALLLAESGHAVAAEIELAAGAPPSHPAARLARALLHDQASPEVRPALQQALDAAGSDVPLRAQVRAHLARVCALQGDRPRARAWADAVVHDRAYPLTPREAAILGPRTRRPRRARPRAGPTAAVAAPVALRFFGPPVLSIAGRPLGSAWWTPSKGRELLWYALAHGSAGFTREEACADLFPEVDGEAGSRALRNLLYELRKLLRGHCGVDTLHASSDGRLRLRPEDLGPSCDVDTRTLERWLAYLRAGELDAVGDLPVLLRGRYLADLPADWTRPFRHYWEREAIHALDLAATHYERAGRAAEALACLRHEVEFCPDDAVLVRRLMVLYHALGDLGGLRAVYLSHRRALREDLEVDPDPAIIALYETLTRR